MFRLPMQIEFSRGYLRRNHLGRVTFCLPAIKTAVKKFHLLDGKAIVSQYPPEPSAVRAVGINDERISMADSESSHQLFNLGLRGHHPWNGMILIHDIGSPDIHGSRNMTREIFDFFPH